MILVGLGRIPDIRLICYAGYPALTGYPANDRITGYCSIKQKFCQKNFYANLCDALGAQITPYFALYALFRLG